MGSLSVFGDILPTLSWTADDPADVEIQQQTLALDGTTLSISAGNSVDLAPFTDHGSLTGLLDDDHPQYFLGNGSEAFGGNLDLSGNDLTGVDVLTVNGNVSLPFGSIGSSELASNVMIAGENVSLLANDAGYLTSITGLNVSELTNDAGYVSGTGNVTLNGALTVTGNFAAGLNPTASGGNSAALGHDNESTGLNSMSWGFNNDASNTSATAFGANNVVSGRRATAWGNGNQSLGDDATAWGIGNTAESYSETVLGRFDTDYSASSPTAWNTGDRLFVIGKGTSGIARADALVMLKSGDTELNGELCVNDDVLTSGDFKYKSARSRSRTISPSAFRIDSLSVTNYEPNSDYISPAAATFHRFTAPLNLPKGAVITEVRFYVDDEEGGAEWRNFTGSIRYRAQGSVGVNGMGTVFDQFALDSNTQTITSISNATVIDTRQYTLFVDVESTGSSNNTRFLGATVDYTIDTLQP